LLLDLYQPAREHLAALLGNDIPRAARGTPCHAGAPAQIAQNSRRRHSRTDVRPLDWKVASPGRTTEPVDRGHSSQQREGGPESVAYKQWSASHAAPPPPLDRPVWVHLDLLYGPPESPDPIADPVPGGLLVATGRVPGLLKRWTRAADGRWFGRVNFTVCDAYGEVVAEHLAVLVPASALTERHSETAP
jgi:hypothetical protein